MALPTELDFTKNPAATPARMDQAMTYIIARLRAVEAVQPEFLSTLNELKAVGLTRLTEVLLPLFEDANGVAASLQALLDEWNGELLPAQVVADTTAAVIAEFEDYRARYLGAKAAAPTVDDEGNAVTIGAMYFDTALDQMRVLGVSGWKDAGSAVGGIMASITPVAATAGQTVFTVADGYDIGYLIVTVNGVIMPPSDYTATNGATVVFGTGLSAGDEFGGIKFGAVTLATVYDKVAADARFALIGAAYTKAEADARYATVTAAYTKAQSDGRYPNMVLSNLSDVAGARTNLGVGSAGTRNDSFFVKSGAGVTGAISAGTGAPSGGSDGDVYLRYS